jgi:pyruvate/2-oxoglutarate/acetoin dehydrogenase E1 component
MRCVEFLNEAIRKNLETKREVVIYGQNIVTGSCLGGLTVGLGELPNVTAINTTNCENTLTGIGFGLMLNKTNAVFFMKQTDFLLLGVDHLVSTFNVLRQFEIGASFTIFPICVDSGFEGPQSSLNNLDDFASLGAIDVFSFTNRCDAEAIIDKHLVEPGFRVICASQRLMKKELVDIPGPFSHGGCEFFLYDKVQHITIVCFNFSLPYGIKLKQLLAQKNVDSALMSVNSHRVRCFRAIFQEIRKTRSLVIIDDGKGVNRQMHRFITESQKAGMSWEKLLIIDRTEEKKRYSPRGDELEVGYDAVVKKLVEERP